jgi:hypothetical protein
MILQIDIPDLRHFPNGFPAFWLKYVLTPTYGSDYKARAAVGSYIRLVEASYVFYGHGRTCVERFLASREEIPMGAITLSATYFESCLTSMHRAVLCMKRFRGSAGPPSLVKLFRKNITFVRDEVATRLLDVRNAIQHMDSMM